MSSLNTVTLIGNVGRDPEIRTFNNGGRVCNLSIATSETWKDKTTGEKREKTDWHRVVIFSEGLIGIAEHYVRKGSKLAIVGKLESRKFQDQSGAERQITEVVLKGFGSQLVLLGEKQGDGQSGGPPSSQQSSRNSYADARNGHNETGRSAAADDDPYGDEIPF